MTAAVPHARAIVQEPSITVWRALVAAAWRQQRVFALLAPDMAPRLHPKPDPIVLLQTPLGWRLVTNR